MAVRLAAGSTCWVGLPRLSLHLFSRKRRARPSLESTPGVNGLRLAISSARWTAVQSRDEWGNDRIDHGKRRCGRESSNPVGGNGRRHCVEDGARVHSSAELAAPVEDGRESCGVVRGRFMHRRVAEEMGLDSKSCRTIAEAPLWSARARGARPVAEHMIRVGCAHVAADA